MAFWRCINIGQMCSCLFNWFTIVLCNDVTVTTMKFRSYDDSLGACSSGDRDIRSGHLFAQFSFSLAEECVTACQANSVSTWILISTTNANALQTRTFFKHEHTVIMKGVCSRIYSPVSMPISSKNANLFFVDLVCSLPFTICQTAKCHPRPAIDKALGLCPNPHKACR